MTRGGRRAEEIKGKGEIDMYIKKGWGGGGEIRKGE